MRHSRRNIGLLATFLVLLFAASGCRVRVPLPPHPYVTAPRGTYYAPPHTRAARHHYRYFPGNEVYFDTSRNLYFYLSDNVWLSGPLLPSYIQIDLNNFVTMELAGPKPFVYHQDTIKRYPPGLRKDKHRKQREKLREKETRQKEQLKLKNNRLDRREGKLENRKNKLKRRVEKQEDTERHRSDPRKAQKTSRSGFLKNSQDAKPEARKDITGKQERRPETKKRPQKARQEDGEGRKKAKKKKKGADEDEQEEEQAEKRRRKAIWK